MRGKGELLQNYCPLHLTGTLRHSPLLRERSYPISLEKMYLGPSYCEIASDPGKSNHYLTNKLKYGSTINIF